MLTNTHTHTHTHTQKKNKQKKNPASLRPRETTLFDYPLK